MLCWGWIDGVRHSLDADSFTQRFTPRRPKSIWSRVNVKRYKELLAANRVQPPGLTAFRKWDGKKAPYSFQNKPKKLPPAYRTTFRAHKRAWAFFNTQPPGYQRIIAWFVMSAKRQETRDSRMATVIKWSALGKRLPGLAKDR